MKNDRLKQLDKNLKKTVKKIKINEISDYEQDIKSLEQNGFYEKAQSMRDYIKYKYNISL